jgi:hypothetical protein
VSSGISVEEQKKQEQGQKEGGVSSPGGNRSLLVQRLLDASANLPAFVHDLLTTQAVTVAGTEAAGFLIERGGGNGGEGGFGLRPIAHIRPDQSDADTRAAAIQAFQEIVKPCVEKSKDGAIEVAGGLEGGESQFCLVTLLRSEGNVVAVSAVITRCLNAERAKQRLQSMQLVAGYFELYTLRRTSEQSRAVAQSHQHVLQLATAVATAKGFEAAAMNLCNELATRAGATRVSLGWLKGKNIKVKALSHTEQFDKKQELVVELEKVMEEALDQDQIVQYDPNGKSTDNVTRSAQALCRSQGGHAVLSLPLRRNEEVIGVITLEFSPSQPLGPQVAHGLAVAVDLLAPNLYDRYQNDRWLITKTGISIRETAKLAIGPKHMVAKLVITLVIGLLAFTWFYKPMYRVTAPFQFVPTEKQSVSAPFEGIIESIGEVNGVRIRPGMTVKAGATLVTLKTDDKKEELNKVRHEIVRLRREQDWHNSKGEIAERQIKMHQEQEAASQERLLVSQIEKATIKAPYDAVVLKGDLTDKLGAPLKEGDVLLELGPRQDLRVELYVNERDIQDVIDGQLKPEAQRQPGKLATTSNPRDKFNFKVERVVPLPQPREGSNVFMVYGQLESRDPEWRPGMMGEARVDVREERLLWQWTHRLIDWVRLKLWI